MLGEETRRSLAAQGEENGREGQKDEVDSFADIAIKLAPVLLPKLLDQAEKRVRRVWQEANLSRALVRLQQARLVRPIWNAGRDVDLHEVYFACPVQQVDRRSTVHDLRGLSGDRSVILGRVGQGKSMLLRAIASHELDLLASGLAPPCLPLFLELRTLRTDDLVENFVREYLTDIGLECDADMFKHLVSRSRVALLLDGFDELPLSQRQRVIIDIERLVIRYPTLRIAITSRPNIAGIDHLTGFAVSRLADLDEETRAGIIRKQYAPGDVRADQLIGALANSSISTLATSPLMVTLLVVHHNAYQKLPENLTSFHEDLFDALLRRHDATKPGFVRGRLSKMDDYAFRQWFDLFCYHAMKSQRGAWSRHQMLELAQKAAAQRGSGAGPEGPLDDAVHITGLVVEEGGEYRFIHKSIMEYHSASLVRHLRDQPARRFYEMLQERERWRWWEETLRFLRVIDRSRYLQYFELAQYRELVTSPSLSTIVPPGTASFSADTRTVAINESRWLLERYSSGKKRLLSVLEETLDGRAKELTYGRDGEARLDARELARLDDTESVAREVSRMVSWCQNRIAEAASQVRDLEDADELLDLDSSDEEDEDD